MACFDLSQDKKLCWEFVDIIVKFWLKFVDKS